MSLMTVLSNVAVMSSLRRPYKWRMSSKTVASKTSIWVSPRTCKIKERMNTQSLIINWSRMCTKITKFYMDFNFASGIKKNSFFLPLQVTPMCAKHCIFQTFQCSVKNHYQSNIGFQQPLATAQVMQGLWVQNKFAWFAFDLTLQRQVGLRLGQKGT